MSVVFIAKGHLLRSKRCPFGFRYMRRKTVYSVSRCISIKLQS